MRSEFSFCGLTPITWGTSNKTAKVQYFNNRMGTFVLWSMAPLFAGVFSILTNDGSFLLPRISVVALLVSLAIVTKPVYHAFVITVLLLTFVVGLVTGQFELR